MSENQKGIPKNFQQEIEREFNEIAKIENKYEREYELLKKAKEFEANYDFLRQKNIKICLGLTT